MKINWEHIFQNKYNYLLTTQILIFVAYPLLTSAHLKFPIIPLLLLISITPALWVGLSRRVFLVVISVGILAFILNLVMDVTNVTDAAIQLLLLLYAAFYFMAIVILIKKISSDTIVTADTIKGGISIYILLGLFWSVLYMIILTYNAEAFTNIPEPEITGSFDCFYYSFITLTTLGYGDIAPAAKYARILAIMEAVTGPVYLAIFVAQIIGLNIARKLKD